MRTTLLETVDPPVLEDQLIGAGNGEQQVGQLKCGFRVAPEVS
jgi:hypothetical protein